MGSEWIVIGYAVMGFLSSLMFIALNRSERKDNVDENLEQQIDPVSIGLKILFIAIFIFSMTGMSKGVIESYDFCDMVVANETLNPSTNITSYQYTYYCEDNPFNEDDNLYNLSYLIMRITIILFIIAFVWYIFLFLKKQLDITILKKYRRRK